jgi:lysophospholipase L1-like esterase
VRSVLPGSALFGLVLLVPACSGAPLAATPVPEGTWRSSAAQAMTDVAGRPVRDETCRQVVRLSAGGSELRLRLSNRLSATPLSLQAASAGLRAAGAAARTGSLRPVTVGGAVSFVVPAGEQVVTDPVALPVAEGDDLLVSLAVAGEAALTVHRFGAATGWCSGAGTGDRTREEGSRAFPIGDRQGLVVEDVAVAAPDAVPPTVIAVGDSLTDAPLPADTWNRWTDVLAQRIDAPVVNAAIAGNRVLLEGGFGRPLVERFDRDVLERDGAGTVVLLAGTNDLSRDLPAADLRRELAALCAKARDAGLRVVLVTIPPADERTPLAQAARREVNAWVRSGVAADVVVDADAVLRDPADPERLASAFDHGDGLHLSPAGHRALGEAVAEALPPRSNG